MCGSEDLVEEGGGEGPRDRNMDRAEEREEVGGAERASIVRKCV